MRPSPFQLSRVFAQGWNAARAGLDEAINPYAGEPEQSRWNDGYRGALEQPHAGAKFPSKRR